MKTENKDLSYYHKNAEENYNTTPISVLRYITELEIRVNHQPPTTAPQQATSCKSPEDILKSIGYTSKDMTVTEKWIAKSVYEKYAQPHPQDSSSGGEEICYDASHKSIQCNDNITRCLDCNLTRISAQHQELAPTPPASESLDIDLEGLNCEKCQQSYGCDCIKESESLEQAADKYLRSKNLSTDPDHDSWHSALINILAEFAQSTQQQKPLVVLPWLSENEKKQLAESVMDPNAITYFVQRGIEVYEIEMKKRLSAANGVVDPVEFLTWTIEENIFLDDSDGKWYKSTDFWKNDNLKVIAENNNELLRVYVKYLRERGGL